MIFLQNGFFAKSKSVHPKEIKALPTRQCGKGVLVNDPDKPRPTSHPSYLCTQTVITDFSKTI